MTDLESGFLSPATKRDQTHPRTSLGEQYWFSFVWLAYSQCLTQFGLCVAPSNAHEVLRCQTWPKKLAQLLLFGPMRSICLVLDWILGQSKNRKVPLYQGLRHLTGRAFEPQQTPPSCFCSENTPISRAPEPRLFRSSGVLQSRTNKPQQPLPVFGLAPTAHIRNPQSTSARSPSEPRSLSPRYPFGAPYDGLSFFGARSYTMQTVPLG
jgi:hypothetical protein